MVGLEVGIAGAGWGMVGSPGPVGGLGWAGLVRLLVGKAGVAPGVGAPFGP